MHPDVRRLADAETNSDNTEVLAGLLNIKVKTATQLSLVSHWPRLIVPKPLKE